MHLKFAAQREEEIKLAVRLDVSQRHLQDAVHELGKKECEIRDKDSEIARLTLELKELSKQRAP